MTTLLADPEACALVHQALGVVASKEAKRELRKPLNRELTEETE